MNDVSCIVSNCIPYVYLILDLNPSLTSLGKVLHPSDIFLASSRREKALYGTEVLCVVTKDMAGLQLSADCCPCDGSR